MESLLPKTWLFNLVVAVADRTSSPCSRFAAAESDLVDALRRWLQLDD